MWLILLFYLLMASTFTIAKTAVFYVKPIYFIALRMLIAGGILLSYFYLLKRETWSIRRSDWLLFGQLILFHIYLAYTLEFWSLTHPDMSSAKACLLYSLSPFITALLCYFIYKQRMSVQQWIALIIGFLGMLPVLIEPDLGQSFLGRFGRLSYAEVGLLIAIASSAYGWILMKDLITRGYSPGLANGIGMFGGGILALITAIFKEGSYPLTGQVYPQDLIGIWLMPYLAGWTPLLMGVGCLVALIIIANLIGYNLYGFLLKTYSPTFLAFVGFITPFFAVIFGWIFLFELPSTPFFLSLGLTVASLYLFYRDELSLK